jgi:hypothetical protein
MFARIKAFFAWVYEWVTIIAATVFGFLSFVMESVDLSPIVGPDKALKIITAVALVKAFVAYARRPA